MTKLKNNYFSTHNHSSYSNALLGFPDSTNTIKDMLEYAGKIGLSGMALTDHEGLSGAIELLDAEKELKEKGALPKDFKVAIGDEIYLKNDRENIGPWYHHILLAKDEEGFHQLKKISSNAWEKSYHARGLLRRPTLFTELKEFVEENKGHLISQTACFLPGTKIMTKDGYKNIEDISSNDYVFNKLGEYEKVNYPTHRHFSGQGFEIRALGNSSKIRCTDNHKFLIQEKETKEIKWIEAKDLSSKKHYLLEAVSQFGNSQKDIFDFDKKSINPYASNLKPLKNYYFKITPMFARFIGYWLGDGHISYNEERGQYTLGLTVNINEYPYLKNVIQEVENQTGIKPYIHKRPKHNRVDISFNSKDLVYGFLQLLEEKQEAENKHIPNYLLNISDEINKEILIGLMLSDGYFRERSQHKTGEFCFASISYQLSQQVKMLLNKYVGPANFSISKEKTDKNGVHHCESYYVYCSSPIFIKMNKESENLSEDLYKLFENNHKRPLVKCKYTEDKKYIKRRIKEIKPITIDETVYCLNNNTHSFHAEQIIVHNCLGGVLGQEILAMTRAVSQDEVKNHKDNIDKFIRFNIDLFGDDFYIETQPALSEDQHIANKWLAKLAKVYNVKLIFSTDSHYLKKEDRKIHEIFLKSKNSERETADFYSGTFMQTIEEVYEYFEGDFTIEQINSMVENTLQIKDKIKSYEGIFKPQQIPLVKVEPPKLHITKEQFKLAKKYDSIVRLAKSNDEQSLYWINTCLNRMSKLNIFDEKHLHSLEYEASVMIGCSKKFNQPMSAYYNTTQAIVNMLWDECETLVGASRGSALGYLSNYLLGITQIDPCLYPLVKPWRHLSVKRPDLPDCDLDAEGSKRDLILQKTKEKFGQKRVLNIATFGKIKTKSALMTVQRGMDLPLNVGQQATALISNSRGFDEDLETTYNNSKAFRDLMTQYPGWYEAAKTLEGLYDSRGSHASGVIIFNSDYTDWNAMMKTPNGLPTTQFCMSDGDRMGSLKLDYLSIDALDKIHQTMNLLIEDGLMEWQGSLRKTYDKYLHPSVIEDNPNFYEPAWNKEIISLFQFLTTVGGDAISTAKPNNLADLMAINSLMRLMVLKTGEMPLDKFARFKKDIQLWYNEMDEYGLTQEEQKKLEPLYLQSSGVPNTQEETMAVLMEVLDWDEIEANAARKSIAKKKKEMVAGLKEKVFNSPGSNNLHKYIWETVIEPQLG